MTKTLFKECARELKEHPWLEEDRDTGLIRVRVSDGEQQAVLIFAWGQIGTALLTLMRSAETIPCLLGELPGISDRVAKLKARKRTPEAK